MKVISTSCYHSSRQYSGRKVPYHNALSIASRGHNVVRITVRPIWWFIRQFGVPFLVTPFINFGVPTRNSRSHNRRVAKILIWKQPVLFSYQTVVDQTIASIVLYIHSANQRISTLAASIGTRLLAYEHRVYGPLGVKVVLYPLQSWLFAAPPLFSIACSNDWVAVATLAA